MPCFRCLNDCSVKGSVTTETFSLLLRDAAILLRPLTISLITPSIPGPGTAGYLASQPQCLPLLVLSDLIQLFESATKRQNYVTHKLRFFASHVFATPPMVFRDLAEEVSARSLAIQRDGFHGELSSQLSSTDTVRPENQKIVDEKRQAPVIQLEL